MDSHSRVQVEYWNDIVREANFKHYWFADDDYLLTAEYQEGTLKLWAMLGYGNDATELVFEGVKDWMADPDLLAGESCMVSRGKFEKRGNLGNLIIFERYGTRENNIITSKEVPLLEVTYERCTYRDVKVLTISGIEYRGEPPDTGKRAAIALMVLLAVFLLVFLLAYLNGPK